MKTWCAVICFIFFLSIMYYSERSLQMVFEENYDKNDFVMEKIDVSKASITTKNITSFLGPVSLYKIEYEIPKLYRLKFTDYDSGYFLGSESTLGLSTLEKIISKRFKSLGYQKEVEKIYFSGIKLTSIEIYGRVSEIEDLKQKIKKGY